MFEHSPEIGAIAEALSKAQGEIENAKKDAENPHFRSKYADLASIRAACSQALSRHGVAVVQAPGTAGDGAVTMTTTLAHSSGQWMRSEMACRPLKNDAQGIGSVITYLRRYALAAMVGVAPDEDDDGEGASGRGKPRDENTAMDPVRRVTVTKGQTNGGAKAGSPNPPPAVSEEERAPTPDDAAKWWADFWAQDSYAFPYSDLQKLDGFLTKAIGRARTADDVLQVLADNSVGFARLPKPAQERLSRDKDNRLAFFAQAPAQAAE